MSIYYVLGFCYPFTSLIRLEVVIRRYGALLLCAWGGLLTAQTLKITSPADGAVVYAGETLTVTVQAEPSAFQSVFVSIGDKERQIIVLTAQPYQFSVRVSAETPSGPHKSVLAVGFPSNGGSPVYSSIDIDIERLDLPRKLQLELGSVHFGYVGEETPLGVTGVFADGSWVGLEDSAFTGYSSDTPTVATVDRRGMVTAVAPGHANITIKYTSPSGGSISARVPVGVPPPLVVLPNTSSLYTSQTEELAASLAIDPSLDHAVTWSIHPALGSIDNAGRYTAPAALSSWQGVTVTATSVADPKISGSAKVWVFPPIAVQITPPSATLSAGRFQDFYANVANGGFHVKWTLTPTGAGTLRPGQMPDPVTSRPTAMGTYIAPSIITSAQTVTLTATSVSDNSKSRSIKVNLVPSVAVSISPSKATVYGSQSQQFAASLNYRSILAVTWSISPNVGAIQASGPAGLSASYTAPASVTQRQTITITATGPDSGGGPCVAKATVTLMPK